MAQTLRGVEGELNGQTSFGGSPTMDPHHGDPGAEEFQPVVDDCRTDSDIKNKVRAFANAYVGGWSWRLEAGNHCHTFHPRLLLFEGMAQVFEPFAGEVRASKGSTGPFHRVIKTDGGLTVVGPLSIDVSEFVRASGVGEPSTPPRLVRRTLRYRYRYRYSTSGALKSTEITNQTGRVTVIKN